MKCTHCEYRLWNLASRQCPECGTPFRPSEHSFVPNSVQFCCPHCEQPYYGTGPQGHLLPRSFDCVQCGRHVDMDEMVLRPAPGVDEEQTSPRRNPWIDRTSLSVIGDWARTVGLALVKPGQLMQRTPPTSTAIDGFWFVLITHVVVATFGIGGFWLFAVLMSQGVAPGGSATALAVMAPCAGSLCATLVMLAVFFVIWGPAAHLLLRVTGDTAYPVRRTYQALFYSYGANIWSGIPCFGAYFGWIWWMVSAVLMLRTAQKVSGLRATIAVLAWPGLLLSGLVVMYGLVFWSMWGTMSAYSGTEDIAYVQYGLQSYASAHSGKMPDHALRLVADDHLDTYDLVLATSMTDTPDIPVGNGDVDDFYGQPASVQEQLIQASLAGLPAEAVAYRLGDCVFIHPPVGLQEVQPRLWVVMMCADPDTMAWGDPLDNELWVLQADGSITSVAPVQLDDELQSQNFIRMRDGLPPLPDPRLITHDQPGLPPS